MGSKKYKNKTCVYCTKEHSSSTGDHVFAKEFFLQGQRDNLPQVPACDECNNKKSELEHYLTSVLPFGGNHPDSIDNLSSMVPKRLRKNRPLHDKLLSGMRLGWYACESGVIVKSTSMPIDFGKIESLLSYIVRGLCWKHMRVQLFKDDILKVMPVTRLVDDFYKNSLFSLNVACHINKNLGNGTVTYEGVQGTDDPKRTVWRIIFYGGIQFGDDDVNNVDGRSSVFVVITADKCESEIIKKYNLFSEET